MQRRVRDLTTAKVLVVGDVMLDRYWSGPARRVSPEAPVPIVSVLDVQERAGGAANVAANAAALGAQVALVGVTGTDPEADRLQTLCRQTGVNAHFWSVATLQTTVKLRVLSQHQQLLRLDFESAATGAAWPGLDELVARELAFASVLVLSDYGKGCLSAAQSLIALANRAGKRVIVDPKGRDFSRYAGAYLLTPNLGEFEAVAGVCHGEDELVERGLRLCADYSLTALLVTRGEHGVSLIQPGYPALHLKAEARDVFDVTGAGDTVCAVLSAAISAGFELADATRLANIAAGLVVGKLGTAVVTNDELARRLGEERAPLRKVLSSTELRAAVDHARAQGEKIVMTNGCFDIIHAGHVRYLQQAAALGDRLIVAVNSNESVKRLKGDKRPINGLAERMEVLAGLAAVAWVVAFDTDTPRALIAEVCPDVLVKGGDYEVPQIAGAAEVLAAGGRVLTLPYHDGLSTSQVIATASEAAT